MITGIGEGDFDMRNMKDMKKTSIILSLSKDQFFLPSRANLFHATAQRSQRGGSSASLIASVAPLRETSPAFSLPNSMIEQGLNMIGPMGRMEP